MLWCSDRGTLKKSVKVCFWLILFCSNISILNNVANAKPKKLLIYYGWPSAINASYQIDKSAKEFSQYDYVVLGDGLSNPNHPDNSNTTAIIEHELMRNTFVFGYIDIGVITQNLSMEDIKKRIGDWQAMGAKGIFFDDFGYDFGTSRARQNEAVRLAHERGLSVAANAFRVQDAFARKLDQKYNPKRLATELGSRDFYLYESHIVRIGQYEDRRNWRRKARRIRRLQRRHNFRVLSITTNNSSNHFDQSMFERSMAAASSYGHEASGWGEYQFSANTAQAIFRHGSITQAVTNSQKRKRRLRRKRLRRQILAGK